MTTTEIKEAKKYPLAMEETVFQRFATRIKIIGTYPDVTGWEVVVGEVSDEINAQIDEFMWGFLAGNMELRKRLTKEA